MASNAMNAFGMVLDNSNELEKEIRAKIIELLGVNSKDEHLTEYIQECVSQFNVSNIEHNYIDTQSRTKALMDIDHHRNYRLYRIWSVHLQWQKSPQNPAQFLWVQ